MEEVVPGARIRFALNAGPDPRCYRVNCDKLARTLPDAKARWTARRGVEQLYEAFRGHGGVRVEDFEGARFQRVAHVRSLLTANLLTGALRWADAEGRQARVA